MKGKLFTILALLIVIMLLMRMPNRVGARDQSQIRGMSLSDN